MEEKKAVRIQTSILNVVEKKALVWLAERQPSWMVSDILTLIGVIGSVLIGAGFVLFDQNVNWLWLSIAGFVLNWYGDSLDGTLARVRGTQRPIYGYYLDHTVDVINEGFMFIGIGLSSLMRLDLALLLFILYLCLTINVSIDAHLKSEFRLTYGKLGPTEFRVIACLLIMLIIFIPGLREFHPSICLFGKELAMGPLDLPGLVILVILAVIYLCAVISDLRGYAKIDPMPKKEK